MPQQVPGRLDAGEKLLAGAARFINLYLAGADDIGVSGVFPAADVKQLVQLLKEVKERAAA